MKNYQTQVSNLIERYNDYGRKKAVQKGISFIDITELSQTNAANMFAEDGLHPSADQYKAWAQIIKTQVKTHWKSQAR